MWFLVTLVLLVATWPLVRLGLGGRGGGIAAMGTVAWLACCGAIGAAAGLHDQSVAPGPPPTDRPIEVVEAGYVGSGECRACHPGEHASWNASYHSSMTREPSPETILAPWDGVTLEHRGLSYLLRQHGDRFVIEMADAGETESGTAGGGSREVSRVERELVMVTGSHHAQVYWFSAAKGRNLAIFAFAYRIDLGRWVPFDDIFLTPPDFRQPTVEGARWNTNCFKCHSTNGRPRKVGPGTNDTLVSEMGIACEACHGPGSEHVAANRSPFQRTLRHGADEADPTIVNPARLSPARASQVCGQCHSPTRPTQPADPAALQADFLQITNHGFHYRPGDDLLATMTVETRGGTHFWPDGMLRVTGREYASMLRTPCHTRGELSCLSCHRLHPGDDDPRSLEEWRDDQLHPGMRGDAACVDCHVALAEDISAHTHHQPGSSGSACMNCHMPHTTYGLLKAIRSHEITSPRASASLRTGRPNACNLCHLDRTLRWTTDHLRNWYGHEDVTLAPDQEQVAAGILWLLTGDAGQRALAAWSTAWPAARAVSGTDWQARILAELLEDPYHPVRLLAGKAIQLDPALADLDYDSLGDELSLRADRATITDRIREQERKATPMPAREELLRNPSGQLREDTLRRLARQRDDRPVYLAE